MRRAMAQASWRLAASQLGHRVGEVVAHRAGGERGAVGDLVDRGAARRQLEHVGLARGERAVAGGDRLGRELGVDVASAVVHLAHHGRERDRRRRLGQEAAHPGGEGAFEVPRPAVAGDDHAAAAGQAFGELLGHRDPVELGHLQVEHGHVDGVLDRQLHRHVALRRLGDDARDRPRGRASAPARCGSGARRRRAGCGS